MDPKHGGSQYGHRPIGLRNDVLPKSIQLNERQLQILAARRQQSKGLQNQLDTTQPLRRSQQPIPQSGDDGRRSPPPQTKSETFLVGIRPAVSKTQDDYLDHHRLLHATDTAETVPTTWSESSSAVSDGASFASAANESNGGQSDEVDHTAQQFYGQRLKGDAKKLYDDTGATWNESRSQVSMSSSTATSTAASTIISNSKERLQNGHQRLVLDVKDRTVLSPKAGPMKVVNSVKGDSTRTMSSIRDGHSISSQEAATLQTHSEESIESLEPLRSLSESLADEEPHVRPTLTPNRGRPPLSPVRTTTIRNPKFIMKLAQKKEQQKQREEQDPSSDRDHDQQRTIVRNLMYKSSANSMTSSGGMNRSSDEVSASDGSGKANGRSKKGRMSWLPQSTSMFQRTSRSGSSGSSGSQGDRDVIKRVLERHQKNRMATQNPRKGSYFKSASSRMKGLISPKHSSSSSLRDTDIDVNRDGIDLEEGRTPQGSQTKRNAWLQDTIQEENPAISREGYSPKLDISKVASMAMDDLIENQELDDSDAEDEEEADELSPKIVKAQPLKSLPSIVKEDEIEIKISSSSNLEVSSPNRSNYTATENVESNQNSFLYSVRKELSGVEENSTSAAHEKDSYPEFVNALKAELANSNPKLYESFLTMFHDDGRHAQPLSMYPGPLDLKTKETIAKMSKYLKENSKMEFVAEVQLISDKDAAAASKQGKVVFGRHLLQATKNGVDLVQSQRVQPVRHPTHRYSFETESVEEQDSGILQVDSADTINPGQGSDEFEVTLTQHVRKSNVPPSNCVVEESRSLDSNDSLTKTRMEGSADSVAPSDDSIFFDSTKKFVKPTIKVPKGKSPKSLPPIPPAKESIPWTSIKLRSVSESNKQDGTEEQIPASWTKVKLRPVSKPHLDHKNTNSSIEASDSAEIHRIVLKTSPKSTSGGSRSFDLVIAPSGSTDVSGSDKKPIDLYGNDSKPIKLTETRGTGTLPIKVEDTSKGTETNPIKLSKSVDSLDLNDGSIMVSLSDENGVSGKEMKLLISKQGMMKVEAIPGETRVNVVWRLDRENIKSALLDMSSFTVKLFVVSGEKDHKDLSFPSSDQCMRFANALHELTNGSSSSDNSTVTGKNGDNDTIYVEQLSEEEQNVLDDFRQRNRIPVEADISPKDMLTKHLLAMTSRCGVTDPPSVVNTGMITPSSPLSEVSGVNTSLLSADQAKRAEIYQKMLKLRIPRDTVKQKMIEDQIDPIIINLVLNDDLPQGPQPGGLSPEDQKMADPYRKMLKMMVPAEAVRHKMQKDGIAKHIISAVLATSMQELTVLQPPSSSSSSPPTDLSPAEQAVAAPYRKMLKMMIPKEAVEHKMKKDGVDAKIIASVVGLPIQPKPSSSKLSDAEESIASAYRKMLKLSIPKESVRHKMVSEGISEKIIASVLGDKTASRAGQPNHPGNAFRAGGFHWSPIADDESIAGSVWSKAKPMSETGCEKPEAAIDISKHVEMFQKKSGTSADEKKKVTNRSNADSKEMAKLIDLNRANNVAITLKAFNDFSHTDLARVIEFLDPFGSIKGDRALFMKDLLPGMAEVKAIKSYTGSDDRLVTAEKWFKSILHIKRIEDKIQVMRTMETFKMDAIVLGKSFQLLNKVCNQIMDSDRLPDLLDMVRQIGNRMNEGRGDAAAGFKLDFLPRLAETKGSDKKTTALDLVVMVFVERGQREALLLSSDFPDCPDVSRIQISDLETDARNLEAAIRKCQKELEQLRKEHDLSQNGRPSRPRGVVEMDSLSETALDHPLIGSNVRSSSNDTKTEFVDRRLDSFKGKRNFITTALKERDNVAVGKVDAPSLSEILNAVHKSTKSESASLSPRASLLGALADKNSDKVEFSLEASIRRLEKFVSEVCYVVLPKLEAERTQAIDACKALASFFCESGGEKTASNLLKILAEFSANIDQGIRKYDEQKTIEARKNASKKRKSLTNSKPPAPEMLSTKQVSSSYDDKKRPVPEAPKVSAFDAEEQVEKKSLVLMVNEMLKVAGDEQIRDFVSGVVYENPDERFRKIYMAENGLLEQDSPKKDILSAIKQRRQSNRDQDTLKALSDLRSKLEDSTGTICREKDNQAFQAPRKSRVATRWSSKPLHQEKSYGNEDDQASDIYVAETGITGSRMADKKSRMVENVGVSNKVEQLEENRSPTETTDSEILMADSHDIDDIKVQRKRRQSYMDRWASKTPVSEASTRDLDAESDIGAINELLHKTKTRQRYINRWANKSSDDIEE
jgi:hypothetical protein